MFFGTDQFLKDSLQPFEQLFAAQCQRTTIYPAFPTSIADRIRFNNHPEAPRSHYICPQHRLRSTSQFINYHQSQWTMTWTFRPFKSGPFLPSGHKLSSLSVDYRVSVMFYDDLSCGQLSGVDRIRYFECSWTFGTGTYFRRCFKEEFMNFAAVRPGTYALATKSR